MAEYRGLKKHDFRGAKLRKSGFHDMKHCQFDGADLTEAWLVGPHVSCTFDGAKLARVHLLHGFEKCSFAKASMRKGNLERSGPFVKCSFADADLRDTSFAGEEVTVFRGCNFAGADLRGALLTNVRFEKCDLTGANFTGAKMSNIELAGTDASKARGFAPLDQQDTKGPAYLALDSVSARYPDAQVRVEIEVGKKTVECMLYKSEREAGSWYHSGLGGKPIGSLTFPDAIMSIARRYPKAKVLEDSLTVGVPKARGVPTLRTKALRDALLAAWREAYAKS